MRKMLLAVVLAGCGSVSGGVPMSPDAAAWRSYVTYEAMGDGAFVGELESQETATVALSGRTTAGHDYQPYAITLLEWGLEPKSWTPVHGFNAGDATADEWSEEHPIEPGKYRLYGVSHAPADAPSYFDVKLWMTSP
ncbi:MAG TPA: hypothetical protein VLZ78_02610 [Terrimesophilobacter sp.]|nr:hypothetical protein [Terrimesophilobacter sp.]